MANKWGEPAVANKWGEAAVLVSGGWLIGGPPLIEYLHIHHTRAPMKSLSVSAHSRFMRRLYS